MRSLLVFTILVLIKVLSRVFYRHRLSWVGDVPARPWDDVRVIALLNHTSLFELIYLGNGPLRLLWLMARRGVVPAAAKTIQRPFVGALYRLVAYEVIPITRRRDQTWNAVLESVGRDSVIMVAPEGRMMRETGLDAAGKPMTVRSGIADILEAVPEGRLLLAYSGGLHHVQVPGRWPRIFKTVRLKLESLDIPAYVAERRGASAEGPEGYREAVRSDLERRRDLYCKGDD